VFFFKKKSLFYLKNLSYKKNIIKS